MSYIQDGLFCKNSQRLGAVNIFRKTLYLKFWQIPEFAALIC